MLDISATNRFIRSVFRSIWSLELLLVLRGRREHDWSHDELIATLRASEQVVSQSKEDLLAAGLIVTNDAGAVRYAPATADLEASVAAAAELYSARPTAVRRLIVSGADDSVSSFADAFRIRRD
jgi:hypothetical protein